MIPTIQVDTSEWQRAARELFATSKRTLPDFINGQMMFVLLKSMDLTKKADKAKIERQMGQVGWNEKVLTRGRNKGKTKRTDRKIASDVRNTLGWRLYWKAYRENGNQDPLPLRKKYMGKGDEQTIVRRMIAHKMSSIAMLSAGWLKAYNLVRVLVKKLPPGAQDKTRKKFGSAKNLGGSLKPATWRLGLIEATASNDAVGYKPTYRAWFGGPGKPMAIASSGLKAALAVSAKDMIDTLAKRLKQDMAKNGMR